MVRNVHYKLIEKDYIFNISTAKIVCFDTLFFMYWVASFLAAFHNRDDVEGSEVELHILECV